MSKEPCCKCKSTTGNDSDHPPIRVRENTLILDLNAERPRLILNGEDIADRVTADGWSLTREGRRVYLTVVYPVVLP